MTPKEEAAPKVTCTNAFDCPCEGCAVMYRPRDETTPADPPLPLFTAMIQRGPIEARPAIVYVIGDGEHAQLMTLAHLSQLLAALPEEAKAELLGPVLADWLATVLESKDVTLAARTKERDALAAKLEKAMAVVEYALAKSDRGWCSFCCIDRPHARQHIDDCPLVAQGFIDRDGHRLEAAGKGEK